MIAIVVTRFDRPILDDKTVIGAVLTLFNPSEFGRRRGA